MTAGNDGGMDEPIASDLAAVECSPLARGRERWQGLIAEQQESGLGVAEFCRERSIPVSSFYGWRRKLAGRERAPGGFVAVKVAAGAPARSPGVLEVRLRGGRRLRVRGPLDRDVLVELIGLLEGAPRGSEAIA